MRIESGILIARRGDYKVTWHQTGGGVDLEIEHRPSGQIIVCLRYAEEDWQRAQEAWEHCLRQPRTRNATREWLVVPVRPGATVTWGSGRWNEPRGPKPRRRPARGSRSRASARRTP